MCDGVEPAAGVPVVLPALVGVTRVVGVAHVAHRAHTLEVGTGEAGSIFIVQQVVLAGKVPVVGVVVGRVVAGVHLIVGEWASGSTVHHVGVK